MRAGLGPIWGGAGRSQRARHGTDLLLRLLRRRVLGVAHEEDVAAHADVERLRELVLRRGAARRRHRRHVEQPQRADDRRRAAQHLPELAVVGDHLAHLAARLEQHARDRLLRRAHHRLDLRHRLGRVHGCAACGRLACQGRAAKSDETAPARPSRVLAPG